jgi:biopolymer transport protein ExbD
VIPFIDIMLVLLIIFMIAAPISSVDIAVEMPTSKIQPSKRPPRPTWISVTDTNGAAEVYVMNDQVAWNEIGTKTLEEWEKNTTGVDFEECLGAEPPVHCRIFIRADSETAYRNVVRVMNRLQDQGFRQIGLVAEDKRR